MVSTLNSLLNKILQTWNFYNKLGIWGNSDDIHKRNLKLKMNSKTRLIINIVKSTLLNKANNKK